MFSRPMEASCATLSMPSSRKRSWVRSPAPQSFERGSSSMKAASPPGSTTTRPSGLRRPEAIFAR